MAHCSVDTSASGGVSLVRRAFVDGACSEHPLAVVAAGEVAAHLIDRNHARPDVLFVFVTRPFIGILEDIAPALRKLLSPTILLGCAAEQIVSPDGWLIDNPAISVLAINTSEALPIRYAPGETPEQTTDSCTILIADPFSARVPNLSNVSGGYASAGLNPGGNRLVLDDVIYSNGIVGVQFPASDNLATFCFPEDLDPFAWRAADGMLVFADTDTGFWSTSLESDGEAEIYGKNGPILSGFVSKQTFPASLTVFGVESGPF